MRYHVVATIAAILLAAVQTCAHATPLSYNYLFFDIPGTDDNRAQGINSAGQVTGYARTSSGYESFIRNADGTLTTFSVPGFGSTLAQGINDAGQVAGSAGLPIQQGFVRNSDGSVTTFSVPGASSTSAWGINDAGQVVGFVRIGSGEQGFVRSGGGSVTTFSVPGSPFTVATAINNIGQTAGFASNATSTVGFVRNSDGSLTTFSVLSAPQITGINDLGQIVGWDANTEESFVREPDGVVNFLTVPAGDDLLAFGINDQGVITGYGFTPSGREMFIATPNVVPAPSSLTLFATALVGLLVLVRQKVI